MANRITRLVFWAGGVVLPTLAEVTASLLAPGLQLTPTERLRLQEAARAVAVGRDDPRQFCARVTGAYAERGAQSSELLYERLAAGVEPQPGMPPLIAELALTCEVRLVSDYPPVWLLPALARSGLAGYFPAAEISYVADLGGYSGILDTLIATGAILPGHSLWVDAHSPRTSEALRKGVDAAIFVDTRRLRRDLALWRLASLPV